MTNLVDFRVTDFLTQVLAVQYNRVIDSVLRGELANTETLAADKTLIDADYPLQVYAPTAARSVTLPAVAAANHPFYVINTSATYALTVKNAGGTTIGIVTLSSSGSFVSDGTTWYAFGGGVPAYGWTPDPNLWSYASASTFTLAGNLTAIFKPSTRLKWTQTTVKYGVVRSSSYSAGVTTVTIFINTDFVLTNTPISANYYSWLGDPDGWPGWFNYQPVVTWTAGTPPSAPTANNAIYNIIGSTCRANFYWSGTAGVAVTGVAFTLPVTPSPTIQSANGSINAGAVPATAYVLILSGSLQIFCASAAASRALGNAEISW